MRGPIFSMTVPTRLEGTSTTASSYGSISTPASLRVITRGRDTWNSYPSRRMVSMRIERWSSPRPFTVNVSGWSVSSTRSATFRSSSR